MPYVINNEITVTWNLAPTGSPLLASDYDIRVVPSDLNGTYTDAGIINYDAPAADRGGSLQYAFTPTAPGRYHIFLATGTGAAHTVLDEKDVWVFPTTEIGSQGSTKAYGALSNPQAPPLPTDTEAWADIDWYSIDAVNEDPVNNTVLYVGRRQFADANGTLMILDPLDGSYTNYTTIPFTDPSGVAMNNLGRVYVLKAAGVSNLYQCWYADSPYSSWTLATDPGSSFSGNKSIHYDAELDKMWWCLGTQLFIADGNATNFSRQQFDLDNDSGPASNVGECKWFRRHNFSNGNTVAIFGGITLGGAYAGRERFWTTTVSGGTTPIVYTDINDVSDAVGSGYGSLQPLSSYMMPDDDTVVVILGSTSTLVAVGSNTGADIPPANWTDITVTEISSQPAFNFASLGNIFQLRAFGKYIIYGTESGSVPRWIESTDGLNYVVSTDTRLTNWNMKLGSGNSQNNMYALLANGGLAWFHNAGVNQWRGVYTIY